MLIKGTDVLEVLGKNLKKARKKLKYTQEFVAENVDISIDLLSLDNIGCALTQKIGKHILFCLRLALSLHS